jgi:type 1 glutamine amidotransferase
MYDGEVLALPRFVFVAVVCSMLLTGQELIPEQKQQVDAAVPAKAPVKPKKPRRMLVTNLSMRNGKPFRGSSDAVLPIANYAFELMGKRTGAYDATFSNDVEMFRPNKIKQFDAICFLNTVGVLFEDAELRRSLLDFIGQGKGFVGIHDAIATFVQYPKYDQWPAFGKMLGATENGGHPWNAEMLTLKLDDPKNPVNAVFGGNEFQISDQAFQFQEPVLRDNMHVLLSIDVAKTSTPPRRVLAVRKEDMDFPMSWIKSYGKGRVFYSALGHSAPVYWNPTVLQHYLAGIQYALGDLKANDAPDQKPGSPEQ